MFYVEVRGVKLRSMFCIYGKEWESPAEEPCGFECEDDAVDFMRLCVEDDKAGLPCHEWRVRREGETTGFVGWKPF